MTTLKSNHINRGKTKSRLTANVNLPLLFIMLMLGGDWMSLFETRPLEDILADIAVGWNDTQRTIGIVRAGVTTEVSYVL